ncbi:gag-pol polyprotein [Trichonephila clavata]|uniref:Gag-pol polyprotein n=1 Tax=Trichonephila clavata TaxID=2740835 RepID=A0A8X6EZ88_TRICU|nr:gag-pol polyprotein [Trichonephila clavata]
MANIEALKKSRKNERAAFTKASELIALEDVDICELEAELNVFKGKVDRLEHTHSNILELLPEKDYDAEFEIVEDFQDKAIRIETNARRIINGQRNLIVPETLSSVSDILFDPPSTNKYNAFEERLIAEFSDSENKQIRKILSEFQLDKKLTPKIKQVCHNTVHYIETTGPPIHGKSRRLCPKIYEAVKQEYQFMLEQGICRHVVVKSSGNIRPLGDYRKLNAVTAPDRFPIPHIQDFSHALHNKIIFSKTDIVRLFSYSGTPRRHKENCSGETFGLFEFLFLNFGLSWSSADLSEIYD